MVTLSNWQTRMSEDMRLRDFRPRTQEGYSAAVRQFLDHVQREPAELRDEDVRDYFLYLREHKKLAPSSINIAVHALRFFFLRTLGRDWPIFDLLRVHKPRMLPVVLSTTEVRAVLSAVRHPARRMALTTIYALGLRLGEGLRLETGHIDSARNLVYVRDGKGARDRAVPLPHGLLHPAHRDTLRRLQLLLAPATTTKQEAEPTRARRGRSCPRCRQPTLVPVQRLGPQECIAWMAAKLRALLNAPPNARAPPRGAGGGCV